MFGQLGLFKLITAKMDWLTERQRVIAENIANIDTPSYHAKELKKPNFKDLLGASKKITKMESSSSSSPVHIALKESQAAVVHKHQKQEAKEESISGNKVDLEVEMANLAETQADYQLMVQLYRKYDNLFKTAIGKNTG